MMFSDSFRAMRAGLVVAALPLVLTFAAPAAADESYASMALRSLSCADWTHPPPFEGREGLRDWLIRYLVGAATAVATRKDVLPQITEPEAFQWMDATCAERPLLGLHAAAIEWLSTLAARPHGL